MHMIDKLNNICTILAVKKAGHLNIKTKMAANTLREYSLASQSERVPQSCFYVKVAYLSYEEYNYLVTIMTELK